MKTTEKLKIKLPLLQKLYDDRYKKIINTPGFERKLNVLNCQTLLALEVINLLQKDYNFVSACGKLGISSKQRRDITTLVRPFLNDDPYTILKNKINKIVKNKEYCHETISSYGIRLINDIAFHKTQYNFDLIAEQITLGNTVEKIAKKFNLSTDYIYDVKLRILGTEHI